MKLVNEYSPDSVLDLDYPFIKYNLNTLIFKCIIFVALSEAVGLWSVPQFLPLYPVSQSAVPVTVMGKAPFFLSDQWCA